MADSDDEYLTEPKRKMRIAYVCAVIAMAIFTIAATVTALSATAR